MTRWVDEFRAEIADDRRELLRLVDGLVVATMPNAPLATVAMEKILLYLLAETHPAGRSKATFFIRHGFSPSSWQVLKDALIDLAQQGTIAAAVETEFGTKYIVEGGLRVPREASPWARTVWFVSQGELHPRLVTAYPAQGDKG